MPSYSLLIFCQSLKPDEQEMLWQKRSYLMHLPEALPLVLSSVTDWGFYFLANVYQIIEDWAPLSPVQAMQLLLPQYPDMRVRQKAIEWILCASSDFLFNALPQLVEALRFEVFESSSLAVALLSLSYKDRRFAFEIYWQLQQRIDHCVDFAYAQRCSLLQKELLERHEEDHLRTCWSFGTQVCWLALRNQHVGQPTLPKQSAWVVHV
ncbi:hypothetical protein Y032_0612g658 [Ancylostoma ceylanicum]|uniref:PIK helical domain-containing protein n=3 Tax=Ancylostoma ceylanicum TaxID=53326 RepID=A0A016WKT4_9BILA|nr:hypothetical protein Y032_0612g658 [Ancylostoma ceylanicum]